MPSTIRSIRQSTVCKRQKGNQKVQFRAEPVSIDESKFAQIIASHKARKLQKSRPPPVIEFKILESGRIIKEYKNFDNRPIFHPRRVPRPRDMVQMLDIPIAVTNRSSKLLIMPPELVQLIFLHSNNLDMPLVNKRVYDILCGSDYLPSQMVFNLSTQVYERIEPEATPDTESAANTDATPEIKSTEIRVLNSKYLQYKFVTAEILKEHNILYFSSSFPISDEAPIHLDELESVPVPSEFSSLLYNSRLAHIYKFILRQPKCSGPSGIGQSVFLNQCISAGDVATAQQIIRSGKVRADEMSLASAMERNDVKLFRRLLRILNSSDTLSLDSLWEKLLKKKDDRFIAMVTEAGGSPSLAVISMSI